MNNYHCCDNVGNLTVRFLKLNLAFNMRLSLVVLTLTVFYGCATLSPDEKQAKRTELNEMGEKAVATLLETKPQLQEVFDKSVGYVVIDMTVTKIPWFGAGGGLGVVVDKRTDILSYIKVSRFEVGGGVGAQKYKVIIIFSDAKLLQKAAAGTWHYEAGAELAAGSASAEGSVKKPAAGYRAFKLLEGGAAATVTVRVARAKPYLK
jgi:lipid-binding SYLF domain-containing protein